MEHVRQIEAPESARGLSMLRRISYADAFVVDVGPNDTRSATEWAAEMILHASPKRQAALVSAWSRIGLKVDPRRPGSVLGWEVRKSTPEVLLLGADSRIGMPGELLFRREKTELLFATFVEQDNLFARGVWALVESMHVRVVTKLLTDASRRAGYTSN